MYIFYFNQYFKNVDKYCLIILLYYNITSSPVGKIAKKKTVWRSAFC